MDRTEALRQLPAAYGLILRLTDLGADRDLISECLNVEVEAVGPMLEVARRKLDALLFGDGGRVTRTPMGKIQVARPSKFE